MHLTRLSAVALLAVGLPCAAFATVTVYNPPAEHATGFSFDDVSGLFTMTWGGDPASFSTLTTTDFQNGLITDGVVEQFVNPPTYRIGTVTFTTNPTDSNCRSAHLENSAHIVDWAKRDQSCAFGSVTVNQTTPGIPDDGTQLELTVNWVHMTPMATTYTERYVIYSTNSPRQFNNVIVGSVQIWPSPSHFYPTTYGGTQEPLTLTLRNYFGVILDTKNCTLVNGNSINCG